MKLDLFVNSFTNCHATFLSVENYRDIIFESIYFGTALAGHLR